MTNNILVSGLINIETTLQIGSFPINYNPVNYPFFGVGSTVSGVGYNVAAALTTLGDQVSFLSLIGHDSLSLLVDDALKQAGISGQGVLSILSETPQSVILYDHLGKRQINVDLKDIQETEYPLDKFEAQLDQTVQLAVCCNINFSRSMLALLKKRGIKIATDVHVLHDIYDQYNQDFLSYADIVFLSDEGIEGPVEQFVGRLVNEYDNSIVVVGLGAEGALLYEKGCGFFHLPAISTRKIVNTIGAGDALFSCFIHFYNQLPDARLALQKAIVFASWKIGEKGAAQGFLSEPQLLDLLKRMNNQ